MSLLEDIKNASLEARKARDSERAVFLITLYSEAKMVGKNNGNRESTDIEVVATIKKFIKNAEEVLKIKPNYQSAKNEIKWLSLFMPKMVTEDELKESILRIKEDLNISNIQNKDIGKIIQKLKDIYNEKMDASLASKILKSYQ